MSEAVKESSRGKVLATAGDRRLKCEVEDGMRVNPCWLLEDAVSGLEAKFSRGLGVRRYETWKDGKPYRRGYTIRSGSHGPDGLLMNFCPCCGVHIGLPWEPQPPEGHEHGR